MTWGIRRTAVGVITLVAAIAATGPAVRARARTAPIATAAFDGSETSTGTAPAGGALLTNTDQIPATATQGSIQVEPLPGDDGHAFDEILPTIVDMYPNLQGKSKHVQAAVACVFMSFFPFAFKPQDEPLTLSDVGIQAVFLRTCLRMALSIPIPPAARDASASASAACSRLNVAAPATLTRTRSGYRTVVSARRYTPRRTPIAVSCRRSGKGLLLTVRPRVRGQTLRKVGISALGIAYRNPSKKSLRIRTTFRAH
jgi:hypothetical protein